MTKQAKNLEDITKYSDAELSLRCYNEKPLYLEARQTNGDVDDLRTFADSKFIYTELQFFDLFNTVTADLAEDPL